MIEVNIRDSFVSFLRVSFLSHDGESNKSTSVKSGVTESELLDQLDRVWSGRGKDQTSRGSFESGHSVDLCLCKPR